MSQYKPLTMHGPASGGAGRSAPLRGLKFQVPVGNRKFGHSVVHAETCADDPVFILRVNAGIKALVGGRRTILIRPVRPRRRTGIQILRNEADCGRCMKVMFVYLCGKCGHDDGSSAVQPVFDGICHFLIHQAPSRNEQYGIMHLKRKIIP